jgi:pimeloyl-ACP methyl ester carboxylesterase
MVEYAQRGTGPPLLVSHGIFGGFDAALHHADTYAGDGFRVIAPSRFGYLGSTMPADATVAGQVDAYAALLDHLGVDRAALFAFSAGSVSALRFALRYPDRTAALVIGSGHYPQRHHKVPASLLEAVYNDRVFWALNTFLPRRLWGFAAGLSNSYVPSAAEERTIRAVMEALFPIAPRRKGAVFDTVVSEPDVDTYPLENITVPTLIVHAADDTLARYEPVPPAARRIPGVRLLTIERGGHLLLGAEDRVRAEIAGFVRSHAQVVEPVETARRP